MSYCELTDIQAIFGVDNVNQWADLNSNESATEIAARVVTAIAESEVDINARLHRSMHTIPFSPVPAAIKTIAATFAGVWLYSSRGVVDYDADGFAQDALQHQRKEYKDKIKDILAGRYVVEEYPITISTAPKVVTDA